MKDMQMTRASNGAHKDKTRGRRRPGRKRGRENQTGGRSVRLGSSDAIGQQLGGKRGWGLYPVGHASRHALSFAPLLSGFSLGGLAPRTRPPPSTPFLPVWYYDAALPFLRRSDVAILLTPTLLFPLPGGASSRAPVPRPSSCLLPPPPARRGFGSRCSGCQRATVTILFVNLTAKTMGVSCSRIVELVRKTCSVSAKRSLLGCHTTPMYNTTYEILQPTRLRAQHFPD